MAAAHGAGSSSQVYEDPETGIPMERVNHAVASNSYDIPPDYHTDSPEQTFSHHRYQKHEGYDTGPYSMGGGGTAENLVRKRSSRRDPHSQEELLERLPSRQLANLHGTLRAPKNKQRPGFATVRLPHGPGINFDTDDVVDNLLQDPDFAQEPEELQNEDIRELPFTLANKRSIKAKVRRSESGKNQRKPGFFKRLGYGISLSWKRFKDNTAEVKYSFELWRGHIKKIEGKFGTGVTSYFLFLKWMLYLNIPVFLLSCMLIVVPQILYRWLQQEPPGYIHNTTFTGLELLTGGGWFLGTELYYGYYLNGTIEIVEGLTYDMRFAYLLVSAGYYLLTLVIVLYNLTKSYKRNYIEGTGAYHFYYVTKVMSGWDFTITNPKAASLKHRSLFKEFQEFTVGFHKSEDKTCSQFCGLFWFRVFTNLIVIGLLAGSAYLIWYISITQSLKTDVAFLNEMAMPLTISAINFILPFAFSILASFEKYENPRNELYMTMIRTIVLNAVTLGGLLVFWLSSVDCSNRDEEDKSWLDSEIECKPCWENFMGEQIYRLVIVDFLFILGLTFFSEFIRRLLSQFMCKSLGYPEFNIGRNTLYLIYSQGLVWLGTFYSPLLSFIMILKVIIIFYVKRISVVQNCVPSVKPWRAGRTQTFINFLLFCALFLCFVAVAYSIVFIHPSEVCGPYQEYNTTYGVIIELFDNWQGANLWLKYIIEFLASVEFLACALIALCVVAYYFRIRALGLQEGVELLKYQISMEGKDKTFLLRLMQTATGLTSPLVRSPVGQRPGYSDQALSPGASQLTRGPNAGQAGTPKSSRAEITPSSSQGPGAFPTGAQGSPQQQGHPGAGDNLVRYRGQGQQDSPSRVTGGTPQDRHNQGYVDKSWDRPRDSGITNANPQYMAESQATNPIYSDRSPTLRPHLPYPGGHYDLFTPPQSGVKEDRV